MSFHEGLAYGESKAETSQLSPVALLERVEDFRQSFRFNSKAGISDFDTHLSIGIISGGNDDLPVWRGKLHRIVYQVPKDLLQSCGVRPHMHLLCAKVERTCQMFAIDFRLADLQRILQ